MATNTTESFLQALEKSDLLDADQLLAAREAARQSDDPHTLARLLVQKGLLTRWQAGQLLIGRTSFFLGRYKLIDLLGRGGMGNVFLARHTMMNRTVAVKMISRQLSQDPASRERFIEEARAVAALDHPNIVHAYTVDSEDDRYYMVLEYVEGQDLQRLVESEGPLDYQRAADLIRQAADGLAHAHSKGMVHRDIKPSNLLVSLQGVVKILDMGMARLMGAGGEGQVSEPGRHGPVLGGSGVREERILGSVDYMAPEQGVQGPEMDHRADIYSLGCTLYYLLVGSPPFAEGTLAERILKHQTEDPPSILLKRPGAPRDLVKICEKMMAKDPADRFQSAGEVSTLLAAWRPPSQRILKAVPIDEQGIQDGLARTSEVLETSEVLPKWAIAGHLNRWIGGISRRFRDTVPGPWRIPALAGCGLLAILLLLGAVAWLGSGGDQTADSSSAATLGTEPSSPKAESTTMFPGLKAAPDQSGQPKEVKRGPAPAPGPPSPGPTPAKPEPGPKPQPPKPEPEKSPKPEPEKPSTPEPPKPEPPKQAPTPAPAPLEPFKDFPKAVDLPGTIPGTAVAGDDAAQKPPTSGMSLVQVHTPAEVPWALNLIGGDRALRNRVFTIQAVEGSGTRDEGRGARDENLVPHPSSLIPHPSSWLVHLGAAGRAKEETPADVAKFWRDGEALWFQWLEGAAVQAYHLRNAALEIHAGGTSRTLALRKPQQVDPIAVDLLRPVVANTLAVEWLPDPSCLRLEILRLEGREGHTVNPAEPVGLKTFVTLAFSGKDRQGLRGAERVEFRLQLMPKAPRLAIELRQSRDQAAAFQASRLPLMRPKIEEEIQNLKGSLGKVQSQPKLSVEQKKVLAAPIEQRLIADEVALWYDDFFQAVHRKGRLHFRVLADLGGYQLELARTMP